MDAKIQKMFNKLKVDSQDLYQLTSILRSMYDKEEDYIDILEDLVSVKDDIVKVVNNLKKELR